MQTPFATLDLRPRPEGLKYDVARYKHGEAPAPKTEKVDNNGFWKLYEKTEPAK